MPGLPLDVTALGSNAWQQLALTASGDVWAWGAAASGALGTGTEDGGAPCPGLITCSAAVQKVMGLAKVRAIAAGRQFGLALTEGGQLFAWGMNSYGVLGHAPGTNGDLDCLAGQKCQPTPKPVAGLP